MNKRLFLLLSLFFTLQLTAQISTPCAKYEVISTNNICGCNAYLFRPYGLFMEANNACGLDYFKPDTVFFEIRNDSTAAIRGVFRTFDDWRPVRVDISMSKVVTGTPRLDGCLNGSPASVANQWRYFGNMSGTIQFDGGTPLSITSRNGNFQVGIGANGQNTDQFGGSGFFTLSNGQRGGFGFSLMNPTSGSCILSDSCVADATPPIIRNCPQNISLTTTGTSAVATWTAPTATDNCSTPSVTSNFASGASFPLGTTTVIYTARDAKNNVAECRFNITVTLPDPCASDATPPVFSNCPQNINLTTAGSNAVGTWTAPTATDNCSTPSVSSNFISGASFPIATTTVIYTARDARNNVTECRFNVIVTKRIVAAGTCTSYSVDNTNDICGCPTRQWTPYGLFIERSSGCGEYYKADSVSFQINGDSSARLVGIFRTATWRPVWLDIHWAKTNQTQRRFSACANDSTAVRDWRFFGTAQGNIQFDDEHPLPITNRSLLQVGMSANGQNPDLFGASGLIVLSDGQLGSINIVLKNPISETCPLACVNDSIVPRILNCPLNIKQLTTQSSVAIAWAAPSVRDDCSSPTLSTTHLPGSLFAAGETTVVYTARDVSGNQSRCSFKVTINQVPVGSLCSTYDVDNTNDICGCSANQWKPYALRIGANNCGDYFKADSVVFHVNGDSSAQLQGRFRSDTWQPVWIDVRFAKANNRTPRYELCQNSHPDAAKWQYFGSMSGTIKVGEAAPEAIQIGSLLQIGKGANGQNPSLLGANASFTLANGTTASFNMVLSNHQQFICSGFDPCASDITKPTFNNCPRDTSITITQTSAIVRWTPPTATDNCSTPSVTSNFTSGQSFSIGTTVVIYTATDLAGNTHQCRFTISMTQLDPCLVDTIAPILRNCPDSVVVITSGTSAPASWTAPTATDNCSTPSVSSNFPSGLTFQVGSTIIVYTARDAVGNTSRCFFNVIIRRVTAVDDPNAALSLLKISPNPATHQLNVAWQSRFADDAQLDISNVLGQIVLKQNVQMQVGDNHLPIDVSALAKGVYHLTLRNPKFAASKTLRFMKL